MHWASQRERGSQWGIAFLVEIMKLTNTNFVKLLSMPVIIYYFLFSPDARKASDEYFTRLKRSGAAKGIAVDLPSQFMQWRTFRHIEGFAKSLVDRIDSWYLTKGKSIQYEVEGQELVAKVFYEKTHGALILVSHLGNFDLAIARTRQEKEKSFNIIINEQHTKIYNYFRHKIFHSERVQFIDTEDLTPFKIASLIERVNEGEVVFIAADRTVDTTGKNAVSVDFLGAQAIFPSGPYIIAHTLGVPVYSLFAFKKKDTCLIKFELFAEKIDLPRKQREVAIQHYAQRFSSKLEMECFNFPLQWYNFYTFWEGVDCQSKITRVRKKPVNANEK